MNLVIKNTVSQQKNKMLNKHPPRHSLLLVIVVIKEEKLAVQYDDGHAVLC